MEPINPISEPPVEVPKPTTSLAARLFNVFTDPGEVFEGVKNSKSSPANWLVPAFLLAIAGAIAAFVIFSQPAIVQQIHDQQASAMDQQVKAGKITQAQADQALAMMDKFAGPAMLKIFGGVGAVFAAFVHIFWWAFILWLMARLVLKTKIPFMKTTEVVGLAAMILVLGAIVNTLLTIITGKLGITLSPALALSNYDLKNKFHALLAAFNVFNLWLAWVSASGLSRLADAPFGKSLVIVLIYWLAYSLFFIAIGAGQFAL
ncbi:MAG: YIP1 family protein [Limisphaerales bacterium]